MPDQYLAREECCRHSGRQRPQQRDYQLRHLAVNPMAHLAGSPATGLTSHCESDKRSRGNIPFATAD